MVAFFKSYKFATRGLIESLSNRKWLFNNPLNGFTTPCPASQPASRAGIQRWDEEPLGEWWFVVWFLFSVLPLASFPNIAVNHTGTVLSQEVPPFLSTTHPKMLSDVDADETLALLVGCVQLRFFFLLFTYREYLKNRQTYRNGRLCSTSNDLHLSAGAPNAHTDFSPVNDDFPNFYCWQQSEREKSWKSNIPLPCRIMFYVHSTRARSYIKARVYCFSILFSFWE